MSETDSKTNKIKTHLKLHTGIYEKNILCARCDNVAIAGFESYLKPLLYGGDIGYVDNPIFSDYKDSKGKPFLLCSNISYTKTKLGLLSILLRANWSKHRLFKDVDLSSMQEDELRTMIYHSDPKGIDDFPIAMLSVLRQKESFREVIAQPTPFKHNKGSGLAFLLGGMFILYYLTHTFTLLELERYSISPKGTMVINEIENDGLGWIMSFCGLKSV